jgi:ribosomal protein S6
MIETLQLEGQREYEVSFWLTSEEAISEILDILASAKMLISVKAPLTSLKLAYPIKKHTSAFFGSCIFTGLPENLKQVEKALLNNPKILRTLIMTPPVKVTVREPRVVSADVSSRAKVSAEPVKPVVDSSILSDEGLEKKLEEILK